ncbi:MAG TPA: SDR family oxidoreductase [Anaerolineae bacterium]|nr:SDR family oxidoreductase [Anaerolineae bacterium]
MDLGIKNKVVLITGGSHGIGAATALKFAQEGCKVAICARDQGKIEKVIAQLKSFDIDALGVSADVFEKKTPEKVVKKTIREFGTVHILINNVGGGGRWGGKSILDTEDRVWQEVFHKNAMAAIQFTREVLPFMIAQQWGRIVTVSSIYGKEGGGKPWFNLAKSAEISLMKTLSMDPKFGRKNITFNSVAPGAIMIPDTGWEKEKEKDPEKFHKYIDEQFPLGRMGSADEVASVINFLCSECASLVNGACISIDGGESKSF